MYAASLCKQPFREACSGAQREYPGLGGYLLPWKDDAVHTGLHTGNAVPHPQGGEDSGTGDRKMYRRSGEKLRDVSAGTKIFACI